MDGGSTHCSHWSPAAEGMLCPTEAPMLWGGGMGPLLQVWTGAEFHLQLPPCTHPTAAQHLKSELN